MKLTFDPVTQQLLQSLINLVNRSTGIVDDVRLPVSSQYAGSYVYASPTTRKLCHDSLAPLIDAQVIECAWHLKVLEDFETLKQIHVPRGKAFLDYLGVSPQVDMVANAATLLKNLKCGVDWIDQKVNEIGERWRLGARYLALGPENIEQVQIAALVAKNLATQKLRGRSLRALSYDWFGAPHIIEEHKQVITLFCESQIPAAAKELDYNDQLASLGLVRTPSLIHLRGPVNMICDDEKLIDAGGWAGAALCHEFVRGIERYGAPDYVLTFEDFTLYQRYAASVQDGGMILFLGDFPSLKLLDLYERIVASLPRAVPLYHWGNIDLAGFKTVVALESFASGREVKPFCMSAKELAENPMPGSPLGLTKLRKLAFGSTKAIRSLLVGIASLPDSQMRECPSEALPVRIPDYQADTLESAGTKLAAQTMTDRLLS